MDEVDTDKTRVKKTPADNRDKTRVAPARPPHNKVSGRDNTRIAPASKPDNDAPNDRTRLAPRGQPSGSLQSGDKTRIAPARNDRTRIKKQASQINGVDDETARIDPHLKAGYVNTIPDYAHQSEGGASALPLEPVNIEEMGDHGVLKKRFVLESVLGAGGMGIVYKAKDLLKVEAQDKDPYVAIKVLSEEFKSHPEAFISLQRESRKSQRIAHPNIVNVYDFDRDGDVVFMTMEFLDGSPLDELIRRYKSTGLPTEDAWSIINGMCSALSHAHAEKIIHSDFKPGNVFVTKKGVVKVFDFGIARAVARVENIRSHSDDRTVFDAGSLGALTPAYASLEMLEGKEPDVRDDIFALGCVAYEMFTAEHPYRRIPADEAARQGIKPKKISNIKSKEWRAIEKAIAFKREERIKSIDAFVEAYSPARKTNKLATLFALLLSVAITVYFVYFQAKPQGPAYSELDIRNKVRIDLIQEGLDTLMSKPLFTQAWQDSVWKSVSELNVLLEARDPWLLQQKQDIYLLYVRQINSDIEKRNYLIAQQLIENAQRYTGDRSQLETLSIRINELMAEDKVRRNAELEKERQKQQQMQRQQKARLIQQQKLKQAAAQNRVQIKEDKTAFNVALENVNDQLRCIDKLNMRNLETAITKLRELDMERYTDLENKLVNALSSCIRQTGLAFPERAQEAKKHGLRIFKGNPVIAAISINPRDVCDVSLAGLGARGKRAICRDKLKQAGGFGPQMVVIPGNNKINAFAMGKYEVSRKELNQFCKVSAKCTEINSVDMELPVSNINVTLATAYMSWLSDQSGQKYRLPNEKEWVYAARSRRKTLDANRNCELSTRGIQKGEGLERAHIGRQNSWGLVNYVGNVQEWTYGSGKVLVAMGGSYAHAMEKCDINTSSFHDGSSDKKTGFRVLREIQENQ